MSPLVLMVLYILVFGGIWACHDVSKNMVKTSWLIISDDTRKNCQIFGHTCIYGYIYVFVWFAASAGVMSHRLWRLVPLSLMHWRSLIFQSWKRSFDEFRTLECGYSEVGRWGFPMVFGIDCQDFGEEHSGRVYIGHLVRQKGHKATLLQAALNPAIFPAVKLRLAFCGFLIEWYWNRSKDVHKI